jgi:hypothetical protein
MLVSRPIGVPDRREQSPAHAELFHALGREQGTPVFLAIFLQFILGGRETRVNIEVLGGGQRRDRTAASLFMAA